MILYAAGEFNQFTQLAGQSGGRNFLLSNAYPAARELARVIASSGQITQLEVPDELGHAFLAWMKARGGEPTCDEFYEFVMTEWRK